jgi:formylglycine-generating enzyme required for sulfatase activity
MYSALGISTCLSAKYHLHCKQKFETFTNEHSFKSYRTKVMSLNKGISTTDLRKGEGHIHMTFFVHMSLNMRKLIAFWISLLFCLTIYGQEGENYIETVNGVQIKMVFVKGGTFKMGSPEKEADRSILETQHDVTLSDYYIGKFEVTQMQWKALMDTNPSFFKGCDDCPVEYVSWTEVQEFITKLCQLTSKKYALPTEAQWEYACRGGSTSAFSSGNCLNSNQANYDGNHPYIDCNTGTYKQKTSEVGSFKANDFGLCDMHGNVHEWCSDWYGPYAKCDTLKNPTGPASGTFRVIRGGNWNVGARYCRSACRNYFTPDFRARTLGFRLVCIPPPKEKQP